VRYKDSLIGYNLAFALFEQGFISWLAVIDSKACDWLRLSYLTVYSYAKVLSVGWL
jgi:hypothetical protein